MAEDEPLHHATRMPALDVVAVPIHELREDPANVRRHDEANLAALREGLRAFGQMLPLIVVKGLVVAGNARLGIMRAEGWTEAAVLQMDSWDEDRARHYAILENRSGELGTWDERGLALQLEQLRSGRQADEMVAGFGGRDVDAMLKAARQREPSIPGERAGLGQPKITYVLVFDTPAQQANWFRFLRHLRDTVPGETAAARIMQYLQDHGAPVE